MDDAERLLAWRNDPVTREMSVNESEIAPHEHTEWLRKVLDSAEHVLLVAEEDGGPVATVRLDRLGAREAEVSVTVAPASRGRRLATAVLAQAESVAQERGDVHLVARIKPTNHASVRAFKKAGYYGFTDESPILLKCERRIARYPTDA